MQFKPAVPALVSAIALATLLSGCNKEQAASAAPPPPQVGVVTLQPKTVSLSNDLPGRTSAFRAAEVRPQVDGIILKRLFKEGADIKAGQQLYQIDPSTYEANLANAQASAEQYRSLAGRYRQLIDEQAVSRQEYDTARAQQQQAEAQVQTAQINLRYTKVLAPISGRIGRSAVTEGALVTNGQTTALATIQQLDPIYVDVTQSYSDMLKLRRALDNGQLQKAGENAAKINLTLEDGSKYPLDGTLEFSEVSVDETTGSVTLRAVFPNPDHLLLPGMFVHAKLPAGIAQQAILAPQVAVARDLKGNPTVMVVTADNKVEQRPIKTARTVGNEWLIEDGLKAGDKVIVEGLQFVKPGATVNPHEAQSSAPTNAPAAANAGAKSE
ncbi:efflux RND transporter periplasmic adaptor subunit [Pseudomonas typographi]|uniref:Efflux RND transporter periplasmic adaptor subunit n=1 Tax=Pseudomonas typographi TaxID=2715964 RepID=A0ABR7YX77_9PSED|nr:efflux RND transporter periplasmic adaptor subunit [Pseudomonas typographi]MBD1550915.1 efflux RND transporter periplasmic adaptor subunit [Pseudomonas typographi]MBD1585738.1 efflux RND transporter periplasmic adaptor subunit [Pseudomonas typographi]MBD1597812.1 efflux RND transporter periplasmic adaptor subunit [Pseudomonas typographi]